jgi:hypothetical protein
MFTTRRAVNQSLGTPDIRSKPATDVDIQPATMANQIKSFALKWYFLTCPSGSIMYDFPLHESSYTLQSG